MQKVIALDIGSYSIKAVEILNQFKSYEITNFYENIIPYFDNIDPNLVLPVCMAQLFQENNIDADRIVTAMPGQYTSSRIMSFNFSDRRKIEAAVYAEVEDIVPFNLEEMLVDSQIMGTIDGKTMVLVVMTRKKFLSSFLEHLVKINIDPKLVDVDSLTFYNLVTPLQKIHDSDCYGIIDIGHEKTSVCLVKNSMLRMFRSINLGGKFLTEFLARDMRISYDEAQRLKHHVSCIASSNSDLETLSPKEKKVAERLTLGVNAISRELTRTIYSYKNVIDRSIDRIYLSGGTSKLKNIDSYLQDTLNTEVVYNRLNEGLTINSDLSSKMSILPQSAAIGLRAVTSLKCHSQINLRRDEFAYVQDYGALLHNAGTICKTIAIVLFLLTIAYVVKYISYTQEIEKLQVIYTKEFISLFPDAKSRYRGNRYPFSTVHRDAINMLKNRITTRKSSVNNFINTNNNSGAITTLKEVSETLPKDTRVNVVEYKYATRANGIGQVQFRVQADSYDTLIKFTNALKKTPNLKGVAEKSSDNVPGSQMKIGVIVAQFHPDLQ